MIIDTILVGIILCLIGYVVHLRSKMNATSQATQVTNVALSNVASVLSNEVELLAGALKTKIDAKFEALGKWLLNELQNTASNATPAGVSTGGASTAEGGVSTAPTADVPVPSISAVIQEARAAHAHWVRSKEKTNEDALGLPGVAGEDDPACHAMVAQIDAAVSGLLERRAKIEAAEKVAKEAKDAANAAQRAAAEAEAALDDALNT